MGDKLIFEDTALNRFGNKHYNILDESGILFGRAIVNNFGEYQLNTPGGVKIARGKCNTVEEAIAKARELMERYVSSEKVLWINTWFSSMAFIIRELKQTFPTLRVIATHKDENCTYKNIADEFYTEPFNIASEEYIEFALDFCKQHKVAFVFPKSYALSMQKNAQKFLANGVEIIGEQLSALELCRSKDAVYRLLLNNGYDKVPDYGIARDIQEFKDLYQKFISQGREVCAKYDRDEGAASFRIISDKFLSYKSLKQPLENKLTYENMLAILESATQANEFKPLMVMPRLNGPEVSVDCYLSSNPNVGFVAIPRYKVGNRVKEIKLNKELIDDAHAIQKAFNLGSAFNVQYRWEDGKPKLLEINTRISGGIHMTNMCGFSITNQLISDRVGLSLTQGSIKEITVTQYETPIII